MLQVRTGVVLSGLGQASSETIRHDAGQLIDGEEARFGDLVSLELQLADVS